jgi:hypothetical protein
MGKNLIMGYKKDIELLIKKIKVTADLKNKSTGFCIGNTAKINREGLYFTPIRDTAHMVIAGVIVYSEKQAIEVAKLIDGKVGYILVDSEKKIPDKFSLNGMLANVERVVRGVVNKSTLWIYKGNDLSVESIDLLLAYLTRNTLRGIGGKKIAILGAGNLGCKLALSLVERGGNVFVTRRDAKKLKVIVKALNYIKPKYTNSRIIAACNNYEAAYSANILIGATQGIAVITSKMAKSLAPGAIIVEAGKGTFFPKAFKTAYERGIAVYRLDVNAAFQGLISKLSAIEQTVKHGLGRCNFCGVSIVSGGLMGEAGEVVVDNINNPKLVYGIADGKGDFIRRSKGRYAKRIKRVQELIEKV